MAVPLLNGFCGRVTRGIGEQLGLGRLERCGVGAGPVAGEVVPAFPFDDLPHHGLDLRVGLAVQEAAGHLVLVPSAGFPLGLKPHSPRGPAVATSRVS